MHGVTNVRETDIHATETLVLAASAFEFELATDKSKNVHY